MSPRKQSAGNGASHPRAFSGRGMLYIMLAIGLVLVVLMTVSFPVINVKAPETATIRIPKNATRSIVHDSLFKYMGPRYTDKVMKLAKLRRTDFSTRYGAYRITKGTNALEGMRILTSGAQTPVRITINGFRSFPLLLDRIAAKLDMPSDSLSQVIFDPEVLARYGLNTENAMALFVDDSYDVYWSVSPHALIEKIGDNYNRLWNKENRKKAAALNLTPAQVMILASIVDEETNEVAEKGTIGRLYINRLDRDMRLQSDPTIRFALNNFTMKRISGNALNVQSPYNTYRHNGLPPGPIRTTGAQTVKAILDSKPHDYIYMCAKEDFSGTHNFAVDYATHTRNALRYQHALDSRGIK